MKDQEFRNFILFFFLMVSIIFPQTAIRQLGKIDQVINPQHLQGSFFIDSPEQKLLFQFEYMGIGTSYNVTIVLDAISSSSVAFSLFNGSGKYIEGVKTFILIPNETRTETYVSHFESDGILRRFSYIQLIDGTKNASGTYLVEKVHSGYYIAIGTGETYIENITQWLAEISATTNNTIPAIPAIEWIIGVVVSVIWYRRKKKAISER